METCSCSRRKLKLQEYDWILKMTRLFDNNKISLTDLTAKESSLIDLYQVDYHNYKIEKENRARTIAEKLGKSPSDRRRTRA